MEITTNKQTKWSIDSLHSEVSFKVKHLLISTVTGTFDHFSGSVVTEMDDFKNATIEFSAHTQSVNTRNAERDGHLRSADFFHVEEYPSITFRSQAFDGRRLVGDLVIKDKAHTVELYVTYAGTVTDPYGQIKAGFEIEGKINRKDFGLLWSAVTETGGVVLSDEVKIHCHIQLVKIEDY